MSFFGLLAASKPRELKIANWSILENMDLFEMCQFARAFTLAKRAKKLKVQVNIKGSFMKVILGSQSPRRREILSYFSLPFEQVASQFDEESIKFEGNPQKYAAAISQGKAEALARRFPNDIIITADTIVFREGKLYGKPRDMEEAIRSFSELVGRWHTVYTGVTTRSGSKVYQKTEATEVLFNPLTEQQIRQYLDHVEWSDKAGGYAIQMAGGLIVRKIHGCYYNVMGLPINTVEELLKNFGIELWDYL